MFYLNEAYYRVIYFLFSSFFNILILYTLKKDIIFISIIPTFFFNNSIDYFIFTEPREILFFYLYSCFCFFIFSILPYLLIVIFDYLKTSTYKTEWLTILKIKKKILINYFVINIITFFLGLPFFWRFFLSFQKESDIFPLFFELSGLNYFYYFSSVFIFTNIILFLLFIILYYFYNKGFIKIVTNKTYIIVLFLIFSTVITPPELLMQITLFCILYICLNIIIFFFFYFTFIFLKVINKFFKMVTN